MMEGALMTEMMVRSEVSKSVRAQEAVSKVDKLGRRFLLRNPNMIGNLGDWRLINDRRSESRSVSFSKGKEKQRLSIRYDKSQNRKNTGFDFTMADGKTVISLQKRNGGDWEVVRKNKDGKILTGDKDLSRKELVEIKNFIRKFNIDRVVNGIVEKVDPVHIVRYLLPATMAVYGVAEVNANVIEYLQKANGTQQTEHTQIVRPEKNNNAKIHFLDQVRKNEFDNEIISIKDNFYKPEPKDHLVQLGTFGLVEDLRMTTLLFSQPQSMSSVEYFRMVGKYLLSDQDANGRYRWRPYENSGKAKNTLVKPLRDVLKAIREDKNPQNQKNFFRVLDAFMRYKGQPVVTPEKVMVQLGQARDASHVDGKQLLTDLNNFNDGPIKAYKAFLLTINPGELLVNVETGQVGIVMNVTKDNKVVVMIVDAKGQTRRVEYDESNFPNSVVFRFGE